MKTALQFTAVYGVMILLTCSTAVKGDERAQPATSAAASPLDQDSQVKPVAGCDGGNCSRCCEPVCCPQYVTEEVEKSCWLVKSEYVCIPGFRWPWECRKGGCDCSGEVGAGCACPPKCGRVRCVNVLEEHKYTCNECGWQWEVKCVRHGECRSCDKGCCPHCGCDPGCGACASTDRSSEVQVTAATESEPAVETPKKTPSLWERLGLR
jgi:hypothetical protein